MKAIEGYEGGGPSLSLAVNMSTGDDVDGVSRIAVSLPESWGWEKEVN